MFAKNNISENQAHERMEMAIIREATREKWGTRTLHGIPRNFRTMRNYDQVVEMQNNLSQGHKTVKHEDCHSPLYQHFEQKAKDKVNATL